MSDNNENVDQEKTPEGPLQTDHGTTTIEENVVAKIAGMAARQVPGVYGMGNAVRRAFSAVTDRITTTQTISPWRAHHGELTPVRWICC